MNAEIKRKWVADLRSGDYEQGQERLWAQEGSKTYYCCLGVLCLSLGGRWEFNDQYHKERPILADGTPLQDPDGDEMLHTTALELAGLSQEEADFLARLNDSGTNFQEIAAYVMEKL